MSKHFVQFVVLSVGCLVWSDRSAAQWASPFEGCPCPVVWQSAPACQPVAVCRPICLAVPGPMHSFPEGFVGHLPFVPGPAVTGCCNRNCCCPCPLPACQCPAGIVVLSPNAELFQSHPVTINGMSQWTVGNACQQQTLTIDRTGVAPVPDDMSLCIAYCQEHNKGNSACTNDCIEECYYFYESGPDPGPRSRVCNYWTPSPSNSR